MSFKEQNVLHWTWYGAVVYTLEKHDESRRRMMQKWQTLRQLTNWNGRFLFFLPSLRYPSLSGHYSRFVNKNNPLMLTRSRQLDSDGNSWCRCCTRVTFLLIVRDDSLDPSKRSEISPVLASTRERKKNINNSFPPWDLLMLDTCARIQWSNVNFTWHLILIDILTLMLFLRLARFAFMLSHQVLSRGVYLVMERVHFKRT